MVRGLVPSMSDMSVVLAIMSIRIDVRVTAILGMEAPGKLPGKLSLGLRSHSDVTKGCVPT